MLKLYAKSFLLITLTMLLIKLIDSYCVQDELFHCTYDRVFNEEEKFDIIFMGNSLSQRTYNATYIDSVLNTKSINIGGSAHHFFLTNAIFQKLIAKEKVFPEKLLVIEISPWQFKEYATERLKFLQMAGLDEIEYSSDYFKAINKFYKIKEYPKVFSSTIRFHDDLLDKWDKSYQRIKYLKRVKANGFELNVKHQLTDEQKKSKSDYKTVALNYSSKVDNVEEIEMDIKSENMVLNLIEDCRKKGINVLFVTAPALNMLYNDADYGRMKYIENFLKSNNAKHINFNRIFNKINLTPDDFSDFSHINKFGNRKLAPILLDSIVSIFGVKKSDEQPIIPDEKDINIEPVPALKNNFSDNIKGWNRVKSTLKKLSIKYNLNEDVYSITRNTKTENSYISIANNKASLDENYSVSIIAKKGNINNYLGLRVSAVYPNRVDAVFDLAKGIVKGVSKGGDFENQSASIESLGEGWYKCTLSAKVTQKEINIILGPTNKNRKVSTWEGVTEVNNDIWVIPNSLKFEEKK
jgi:hypothetical protein